MGKKLKGTVPNAGIRRAAIRRQFDEIAPRIAQWVEANGTADEAELILKGDQNSDFWRDRLPAELNAEFEAICQAAKSSRCFSSDQLKQLIAPAVQPYLGKISVLRFQQITAEVNGRRGRRA